MPGFTPGRRWQLPYLPFKQEPFNKRALATLEMSIKGPLFGCRMCGNCLLQETAFICPMECPKGLRNGPCGGSTSEYCYVDETRPCVWYKIYERSFAMGREDRLLEVLPPLDWDKVGSETWGDIFMRIKEIGIRNVVGGLLFKSAKIRNEMWENIFKPVRQPDWWQGDSQYHAPKYTEPVSELERRLKAGEFVVTAEIAPPISVKTDKLLKNIEAIKPYVTAINFTDNSSATPRTASWACSAIAIQHGAEPVMQIAARDQTRVGLQSAVLGAYDLGIRNMFCVSGDSMKLAPAPRGRMDIVDVDSIQMLWILRRMRDEGKYLDGREMKTPPRYFIGAAASPFASEPKFQALREHKKINAGAQFLQTNLVFDIEHMEVWLNELAKRNILDKAYILIGITPLKSFKLAKYINEVPGVSVPASILKRMEDAEKAGNEQEEGLTIALELIEKIKKFKGQGVSGLHIMAVGWDEIVPRIIVEGDILPKGFAASLPKP
ncbi:MAG TPA: methylenetetrahydrofolate reductase C-terminal domain-containing protein [Anaerolineales bacterium]